MMIEHHRAVVAMTIRADQGGEIDRMRSWLGET
jgi:hypothetical protein